MMMNVHLHIGFHKTASTYLQLVFSQNRKYLDQRNVSFWRPQDLRPKFTNAVGRIALNNGGKNDWALLKEWRKKCISSNCETLVLSEENFVGMCGELFQKGEIYPHRRARLRVLTQLFSDCPIKVFLGVRSYVGYFPAAYAEMVRHQPFVLFRTYLKNLDLGAFSWTSIVRDIAEELPDSEIVVWRYEDFGTQLPEIVDGLAGTPVFENFEKPSEKKTYPSPSHKAISAMEALVGTLSAKEIGLLRGPMERSFPKGPKYGGFDPWSWVEKARLEEQYEQDLRTLAEVPQVRATYTVA